jgi:hypothetical protein
MSQSELMKRADALARERTMSKRVERANAYGKYLFWDREWHEAYDKEYNKILSDLEEKK